MKRLLLLLFWIGLAAIYLYPGSQALWQRSEDMVMSDATDITTLPYSYDQYALTFREHPLRYFYGSVYLEHADPEKGLAAWTPWNERITALLLHPVLTSVQISTASALLLMVLDAVAMLALVQALGWPLSLGLGLALAWAFSSYTLARAQVHPGFVGIYHIPLIFLGFLYVARGRDWKSLAYAALCFLGVATVAHYYIITAAFLSPLCLFFLFAQPEVRGARIQILQRLALAALPVIAFLMWNFAFPIPAEVKARAGTPYPTSGATREGQIHPFLYFYAARPIDYFTANLWPGSQDFNPLRKPLNEAVQKDIGDERNGNSHERTNGIRWLLLLVAATAVATSFAARAREPMIYFFLVLGAAAFWLSLAPTLPALSPSYWLQSLVAQIRVPSRAGIWVHFSVLMIVGYWLSAKNGFGRRFKEILLLPAVFPLLILLELPPLASPVRLAKVRPQIEELSTEHGPCGIGLYFPFVSNYQATLTHYSFLQSMRGSTCGILNSMDNRTHIEWLTSRFPPNLNYLNQLAHENLTEETLIHLAQCVPLSWIVFDQATPPAWREQICAHLGWKLNADLSCIAPDHSAPLKHLPDDC